MIQIERKKLEQVLEALRFAQEGRKGWTLFLPKAITIAREALAQPEPDDLTIAYERGFIDGMAKQAQSSVDKAVNAMTPPEYEFVTYGKAWATDGENVYVDGVLQELPEDKPEQEPVAWMTINAYGEEDDIHYENPEGHLPDGWTYKPLYTHPPKVQPEPLEYWNAVEGWVKIDEVRKHFGSVGCGTIYKTAGEGRSPIYTTPPKRERAVFPTMLRKMWSGSEVQAWLDENVNKEKNT